MSVTYRGSDPVGAILDGLLTALNEALTGTDAGLPPRMEIAHGSAVTFDSAPMGWVRPVLLYSSQSQFGSPDNTFVPRKQPFRWAVDVEIGVIRCTRTIQSSGSTPVLPSADEITAEAGTIMDDCRALRAVPQYLYDGKGDVLIKQWQPIGPSGGVAGGALTVAVGFADCRPTIA